MTYLSDIRSMPRPEFTAFRCNARRGRCSYRVDGFYIGREVTPCDNSGVIYTGIWDKLRAAQWARSKATIAQDPESRQRWIRGAREILAMKHRAPFIYWQWSLT